MSISLRVASIMIVKVLCLVSYSTSILEVYSIIANDELLGLLFN